MKKALSVFLMLALVGSVFAAEPVADVNIAEFKGDASVQWGVDLDTMKTGFKNSASVTLKLNLLNEGSKSTTGDGVWGELVIKTDGDTFAKATNTSSLGAGLGSVPMTVVVDKAQINFGPAYVGITSGDTEVGKLKMDAAVKSADSDKNAMAIGGVGPKDFTQGITLGFDHDMFNVAADVRSYNSLTDIYVVTWTGDYIPTPGDTPLSSPQYRTKDDAYTLATEVYLDFVRKGQTENANSVSVKDAGTYGGINNQYTHAYAFALEGEFTGVENLSVKAGVSYNFNKEYYANSADKNSTPIKVGKGANTLGYSTSAGYKFNIDDMLYIRPQLGLVGYTDFYKNALDQDVSHSAMDMAVGILFGWGDIGVDAHPDVYFLDNDSYKKVSPGVGLVAKIPLLNSTKTGDAESVDNYKNGRTIEIAPSFYSGEIIPGLTSAVYSNFEIGTGDVATLGYDIYTGTKYAIPVAAGTITPQVGMHLGGSKDALATFETKVGVEVAGFVSNTTFFTVYESGNLVAKEPGLGTLNFGTKISF